MSDETVCYACEHDAHVRVTKNPDGSFSHTCMKCGVISWAPDSRSEMRRRALQNGEEVPTFDAHQRLRAIQAVVDEQAEDEGLWIVPMHISEDFLQRALRRLHAVIEAKESPDALS